MSLGEAWYNTTHMEYYRVWEPFGVVTFLDLESQLDFSWSLPEILTVGS